MWTFRLDSSEILDFHYDLVTASQHQMKILTQIREDIAEMRLHQRWTPFWMILLERLCNYIVSVTSGVLTVLGNLLIKASHQNRQVYTSWRNKHCDVDQYGLYSMLYVQQLSRRRRWHQQLWRFRLHQPLCVSPEVWPVTQLFAKVSQYPLPSLT